MHMMPQDPPATVMLPDGINEPLSMHFAMQLCDSKSFQSQSRVCGDDRTALSKRSLLSLAQSLQLCLDHRPQAQISLMMFTDCVTQDLENFCREVMTHHSKDNLKIDIKDIYPAAGIADSISTCYHWMQDHGHGIVGQFQDDYLFRPQAIADSVDMLLQIQQQHNSDVVISPHHFAAFWRELYHNWSSPRFLAIGQHDYWIQIYDIACTFLTTHGEFSKHWDLYDMFFELCRQYQHQGEYQGLENRSLNHMMTQRGVLALSPIHTLSHHVQSQRELDPHQDWRLLWDSVDIKGFDHA